MTVIAAFDRAASADRNQRNQEWEAEEVVRRRDHGGRLWHHDVLGNNGYRFVENRKHGTAVAWPDLCCCRYAQNRSN